ncbi:MAG: DEAD/DEAH box helicase [Chloroflexota bacterium]|nr:DEAD/DEAH box helicase [Chloroflexota bacterium]MDQ5864381.1 DEAD/DEAH box helicase [Chloroflexota bacterium]
MPRKPKQAAQAEAQPGNLTPEAQQIVADFRGRYPFPLDPFQEEAIAHLAAGESVMVAAPTGTGKTVVAEFGIFRAARQGFKVMYTTPIKALSNQKFRDLREQYGDAVGLLTGDVIENREGSIIVMTTEVLRNMLLQTPSELWGVGCIIFDEVHYLADPERGTTWEESIIMCPKYVQLVCLSATVTNAPEIADWITRTHQPVHLVTHLQRAVPLSLYYFLDGTLNMVINAQGQQVVDFNVGGELKRKMQGGRYRGPTLEEDTNTQRERREPGPREIVEELERADLLPAIYFQFSRRDCEAAAEICSMIRLKAMRDRRTVQSINEVLASYMERLTPEDRKLQQVQFITYLARRGFGFHHAGLLPILKQLVEELFNKSLMRVVFATDTLALGVNMPARTVVIGGMSKYDGVSRRPLIPNEFQQMSGRAGRRGIDEQGHVVLPYSPWVTFHEALNIATGPLRPVESAFTMRYNSVLNLWDAPKGERVLTVMRASLLNFQQSRRLRDLEQELEEEEARLAEVPAGCLIGYDNGEELLDEYEHRGREVEELRRRERKAEQNVKYLESRRDELPWRRPERDQLRKAFRSLPQGALVHIEGQGWAAYLGRGLGGAVIGLFLPVSRDEEGVRLGEIFALTEYRQIDYLHTITMTVDLPYALATLAVPPTMPLEELLTAAELEQLRESAGMGLLAVPDLQAWIEEYRAAQMEHIEEASIKAKANLEEARAELAMSAKAEREHVCHHCPVRKEHRSNRRLRARLLLDRDSAEKRLSERRHYEETRLQTTLKGLTSVLVQFAYLRKGELTYKARKLADIFDTNALMITEMVEGGYFDGLKPQDLAEVFSWFAYDRDIDFLNRLLLPRYLLNLRRDLDSLQNAIFSAERRQDLALTRGYNPYFYGAARAWCKGTSIADLLDQMQMSEGDLVMTFNKTLDLMRQVRDMLAHQDPENPLRATLSEADKLMRRGVVEMAGMIGFAPRADVAQNDATPEDEEDEEELPVGAEE